MTKETQRVFIQSSATFYCVHGHPRHWPQGKSEEQKLREQLEAERRERARAQQNIAMWQDEAREAKERATRERIRANAYKGHATRITKRAKAGVCPCCNRTFQSLAKHMAAKHPQFTPIEVEQVPA
jgi:DNA repair exonuclease SbcCD ATPase subunit